jgi:hypothetical protein
MEMIDLVDEFFKRNLTEAEAQSLEELLDKSPEASSRFGDMLQQEYVSLGLPEPKIPKNFHSPVSIPPIAWFGPVLGFSALVGVALVSLAWWAKSHSELKVPVMTAALTQPPIVAEISKKTEVLPPPPIEVPQKLEDDSVEGSRLSVVVELEKLARVQVRVLNPQDQSLRVLFEGPLSPGKWAIQWDGRLSDGTEADPGKYLIQVKAGSQVMSKSVSVEPLK